MSDDKSPKQDDASVPECNACGACCFSEHEDYVSVSDSDYERMDDEARSFVWERVEGWGRADPENTALPKGWEEVAEPPVLKRYMRIENGRCIALGLHPYTGETLCKIYPIRPDVCRNMLIPGSDHCRYQRDKKLHIAKEALRASAKRLRAT